MPRGRPGTGPHARKRYQLQGKYSKAVDAYMILPLSREEAQFILKTLGPVPAQKMGAVEATYATAIIARIAEQVMGLTAGE